MVTQKAKIVLTTALAALAVKELTAFVKAEGTSQKTLNNMSKHVLVIAQAAEKANGDTAEIFKEMCKHAERTYVEQHSDGDKEKRVPMSKLSPSWKVYKSQVMAGIKANLKPSEYETVYDLQQDTPASKRGTKERNDGDGEGTEPVRLTERIDTALKSLLAVIGQTAPEHEAAVIAAIQKAESDIREVANIEEEAETKGPQTQPTPGVARPAANAA